MCLWKPKKLETQELIAHQWNTTTGVGFELVVASQVKNSGVVHYSNLDPLRFSKLGALEDVHAREYTLAIN